MSKIKVAHTQVPAETEVLKSLDRIDYSDAYGFHIKSSKVNVNDVARAFFTTAPAWVVNLMKFRDKLGGMVGLKTMGKQNGPPDFSNVKFLPGEKYGLFNILEHHPNEIIMGTDDKHLNFRVSLYLPEKFDAEGKKEVVISTIVKMHNAFGKFYLGLVKPFHKMVVPSMLGKVKEAVSRME